MVELLKWLKVFSLRYEREYYSKVDKVKGYAKALLSAYSPENVATSAYALDMLGDYINRSEKGEDILDIIDAEQATRHATNPQPSFSLLTTTIEHTDNILMCYYNLKFINEVLAETIEPLRKERLQTQLHSLRYNIVIENVKTRLYDDWYLLENALFNRVYQVTSRQDDTSAMESSPSVARQTTRTMDLQSYVLGIIGDVDAGPIEQDPDDPLTVYLSEQRAFNRFKVELLGQIHIYEKLHAYQDDSAPGESPSAVADATLREYFNRIKAVCVKTNST